MDKIKIHAELTVEKVDVERGEYGSDPKTNYIAYSTNFLAEDAIRFSCRPSQLEGTLKALFKVDDPLLRRTKGLVPNMHSAFSNSAPPSPGSVQTTLDKDGKPIRRFFLTRDPIYKAPEGSTKELISNIGREILGRDPGEGVNLFGDLLDEIITPRKREARRNDSVYK